MLKRPKRDFIPAMQSMSKHFRPILLSLAAGLLVVLFSGGCAAQDVAVTIEVDPAAPTIAHVSGRYVPDAGRPAFSNLSFVKQYAGTSGLGDRISDVSLKDVKGGPLSFRIFQLGEYVAEREIGEFSYSIDLTPLKSPTAAGHVSWLTPSGGILFLNDVLPESQSALVTLKGLVGISATGTNDGNNDRFSFLSRKKGVLVVGRDMREPIRAVWAGKKISLASAGGSPASDRKTLDFAVEIFKAYSELYGPCMEAGTLLINLQNYPAPAELGNFEADTRGSTISIISSGVPFESQSDQRLHEQLRHEIFHLWIPEGVNLTGNYDWFYEGFALYQSLKLGVAVNRIRFDDYLDTLSRAYDIDRRLGGKTSLIDASRNRWSGDNNTVVYAGGMLVAFLCDLALLNSSKGKAAADDIIREVYTKYSGTGASRDGNESVMAVMRAHKELVPVVDLYVSGTANIEWTPLLAAAGLRAETQTGVTTLNIVAKPTGSQKRLLDKLGYNNWRKLISK